MKKLLSVFLSLMMALSLTSVLSTPVYAVTAQNIITNSISSSNFIQMSLSMQKAVLATASSDDYVAQLAGTDEPEYLLISGDGMSYISIDLESVVREKLDVSSDEYIFFDNLTCIDNIFYVTGNISAYASRTSGDTPFYLATQDGSSITATELSIVLTEMSRLNWNLYYSNGYYVAANNYMIIDVFSTPYYYISEDLETWKQKTLTQMITLDDSSYQTVAWSIAASSDKGLVFEEGAWYMFTDDYEDVAYSHYVYTTDFDTYNEVSTLNSNFVSSGTYSEGSATTSNLYVQQSSGYSLASVYVQDFSSEGTVVSSESLKLLASTDLNSYVTLVNYANTWNYFAWYTTQLDSTGASMYIETDDQNYVYVIDNLSDSATQYTTTLEASKFTGSGVIHDEWSYAIYDGQYLMMTKDNGKTIYKVDTGLSDIVSLGTASDNLILNIDNDYDYYIAFSTLESSVMPFVDVSSKIWYYDYILEAYEAGLMTGVDETHFDPDGEMSRGMVVTVLYRMAGKPEVTFEGTFTDVKEGLWYSDAIEWAVSLGIVSGYGNGTFGPDDSVTREQMAVMLRNYCMKYVGLDTSSTNDLISFNDYKNVSSYAFSAVGWTVDQGIITGADNGTMLYPTNTATRAECAKMLLNASKLS